MDASAAYFKADQLRTPTLDQIADHYRERHMAAVVFTVDAESATGHPPLSSEDIAEGAARNNDVLIPFASVDPRKGAPAVERAERLVSEYGVRGLKLHPSLQGFIPNDEAYYPLYEAMQRPAQWCCSTPARPASVQGFQAAAGSSCATRTPC